MARHIETTEIPITELRIGMYVTKLQVPWSATPFPLEGVLVENNEDIIELTQYGNSLFIDQSKSLQSTTPSLLENISDQTGVFVGLEESRKKLRSWRKYCNRKYQIQRPLNKELIRATYLFERFFKVINAIRRDPEIRSVKNTRELEAVSKGIVDSIIGHPDALVWLSRVKTCGSAVFDHCLRTAIWASLVGRSMGLIKSALQQLNQAILLSGVGKIYLDKKDWQHCDNPDIHPDFAKWSSIALKKLAHSKIEKKVLIILANMTERLDGSGFPHQKQGRAIHYLSQIAGLAETFDLCMYPIRQNRRRTVGQSLCRVYWCRDRLFDADLIEELIQAVGLYPAGSAVELSNGEKGVVIEESKERRIRARVIITHDKAGRFKRKPQVVNLGGRNYREVIIRQESAELPLNGQQSKCLNKALLRYHFGFIRGTYYQYTGLLQ
ncbi:DUF3391 domain-containing protein [Aliikangiella sp. G2MR2-5]|uniref:HD-GYP domain-containing protein n=1 Tax=Aliikangiella sp. G2MR2-5 TaxID=2788943 RepID=UPI0018ABB11E|nr:DUF3391 domain-containing protein [Aliikangiella sp. G2MR2-5]